MFRPSPPSLKKDAFALFYPLTQSPESSSATRFTTTTTSSADPLPITVTSLLRLGSRCRSYNGPAQAALHRVRSITFIAHPPPLPRQVTERISGFGSRGYLALPTRPPRGSHQAWVTILAPASFRSLIGYHSTGNSLLGQPVVVSSGTLAFTYMLPPFKAHVWTCTR